LYRDASSYPKRESDVRESWHEYVPPQVIEIIYKNWARVEQYADADDMTVRLFGMKFPQEGLLSS
jgi:hypothetical protein